MSEEENKVLEYFKNNQIFDIEVAFNYIPILLNIIEGLQTKVDTGIEIIKELKEIEKSHQEENGKLRVELEQEKTSNKFDKGLYGLLMKEKEKNKELEIELSIRDNINVDKLVEKYKYYRRLANSYQANCISKDKIREIQTRLYGQLGSYVQNEAVPEQERIAGGINIINKILKGE